MLLGFGILVGYIFAGAIAYGVILRDVPHENHGMASLLAVIWPIIGLLVICNFIGKYIGAIGIFIVNSIAGDKSPKKEKCR